MREIEQPEPIQAANERQALQFAQFDRMLHISRQLHDVLDLYPKAIVELPLERGSDAMIKADCGVMKMADTMIWARFGEFRQQGLGNAAQDVVDRYFPPKKPKVANPLRNKDGGVR